MNVKELKIFLDKILPPLPKREISIPYIMFKRVEDQAGLLVIPEPKPRKSKMYFLKQFKEEFNLDKFIYELPKFGWGGTGVGNIWAARDFWHLLYDDDGNWRLSTVTILKIHKPLYILKEKLIKNFKGKNYIYVMKKSLKLRLKIVIMKVFKKILKGKKHESRRNF